MFWSERKSNWNCALNFAFSVFISPVVWNMCENLHYEWVYFKELHNEQEYDWPTVYRAWAAVVSTITSLSINILSLFLKVYIQKTTTTTKQISKQNKTKTRKDRRKKWKGTEDSNAAPLVLPDFTLPLHMHLAKRLKFNSFSMKFSPANTLFMEPH